MATILRAAILELVPRWLRGTTAGAILQAIALHIDLTVQMAASGVRKRFPGADGTEDAIPRIAADRQIIRGRYETAASHNQRLVRWWDDHKRRGNAWALLEQLFRYFAAAFAIECVTFHGDRYSLTTAGVVTHDTIAWVPDNQSALWARWWLFYRWPSAIEADGTWADAGNWDDGGVWDASLAALSAIDVDDTRALPKTWGAGHATGKIVLLPAGAELWDYPPGTWGDSGQWSTNGAIMLGIG